MHKYKRTIILIFSVILVLAILVVPNFTNWIHLLKPSSGSGKDTLQSQGNSSSTNLPRFDILETTLETANEKIAFDLRVYEILDEEDIRRIAYYFRNKYSQYKRVFILYYLPNMPVGEGAWAISHFEPELRLQILGITKADENKTDSLITKLNELAPKGEIIGTWLDQGAGTFTHYLRISKNSSGQYTETTLFFNDLSHGSRSLTKIGDKYTYESSFGEFYKIESDGSLGLYSENGCYGKLQMVND